MDSKEKMKGTVGRREVIQGAAATGLVAATGAHRFVHSAENTARRDAIQRENAEPGTRDWMLTKTRTIPGKINKHLTNGRCQQIEGYCSANSLRAGETLKIMVSARHLRTLSMPTTRSSFFGVTMVFIMAKRDVGASTRSGSERLG